MTALIATAALVFLRAIQQQNVQHRLRLAAALTSFGLAAAEAGLVLAIVDTGWAAVPWIGAGGAIGVVLAIETHHRVMQWIVTKIS